MLVFKRPVGVLVVSVGLLVGAIGVALSSPADAADLTASSTFPRVFFVNTSIAAGVWQIGNTSVLPDNFEITDFQGGNRTVVDLQSSTSNANSLMVDTNGAVHLANDTVFITRGGNVGVGTTVPLAPLHVAGDVRVADWTLNPGGVGLFFLDANAGFAAPVKFRNGTPDNTLVVTQSGGQGRIGVGTDTPEGQIHIFGGATQDLFSGIGPSPSTGPAFNFGYSGSSFGRGSGFFNVRPDASATAPNPSLRFATANVQRMIITNTGNVGIGTTTPGNPLQMGSGAFVSAGGVWTDASSREYKQDVQPLSGDEARTALERLDPVKFAYKADPAERHVGFIAEDVPDLVATPDRKAVSPMDIVAVLTRVLQEQQRVTQEQQRLLQEQQRAIAGLTAEVAALRRAR